MPTLATDFPFTEAPRIRRRRRHWPSDRQIFLVAYLIFVLDQVAWVAVRISATGHWYLVVLLPIWVGLYKHMLGINERARQFEERYNMPYPPMPRWTWLGLALCFAVAMAEWL